MVTYKAQSIKGSPQFSHACMVFTPKGAAQSMDLQCPFSKLWSFRSPETTMVWYRGWVIIIYPGYTSGTEFYDLIPTLL